MKNIRQICAIVLLAMFCCLQDVAPVYGASSGGATVECSEDGGMFSGLVKAGADIFNNLRDLIYVVAGFGIIAVAVGGFFGYLNWKWLGAILIALVVIASTGELITTIVGCRVISQNDITDTLVNPDSATRGD
ncbi:MAG: hypothetical protein IKL33_04240 [Alphaproteobacteria bacterium]|nr:hypothetical protein [Alphaproteobacteria bacterium]